MRVAIMTQPLGGNYGGIMQAWALQKILKDLGHEPVTIDRQPSPSSMRYRIFRFLYRFLLKVSGRRKAPVKFEKYLPIILNRTRGFIGSHIVMSEPLYSTKQIKKHFDAGNYQAVIVGSDQTWRPKYSPCIYNYFLDFIEDKDVTRIAYASSFGVDQWEFSEEETRVCAGLSRKFNAIGVREISGVDLCRNHLNVDALNVLDPTILVDKESYLELIGKDRIKGASEGIFTYFLDKTAEKIEMAGRLGEELDEPVLSCQAKYSLNEDFSDISGYMMPDVKDWLSGFANAKFVLTDSFHGMVFSLIFQKPFYVIKNKERGAARFSSLLSICGLEDRILDEDQILDYTRLARGLKTLNIGDKWASSMIEKSVQFLTDSLPLSSTDRF